MTQLNKSYTWGNHRLISPAQTLTNIQPHLSAMGITRCADVTGLDRLGIPVYCAMRPTRPWLQVSNGKGISPEAAKVSALMEGIEIFHAETPGDDLRRDSLKSLAQDGCTVVAPDVLPQYRQEVFFSPDFKIDWVKGENLLTEEEVWLPASAVYDCSARHSPNLYWVNTNGLASGNHLLEATLHGLYEVIERDAIARLSVNGRLNLQRDCQFIDLNTVDDPCVGQLSEQIEAAEFKLVLIRVKSCIPIETFWAVLLDRHPYHASISINIGYGTHLSPAIAATRAITEAAQSRLTFIHGARDDIKAEQIYPTTNTHDRLYRYFDRLDLNTAWQTLTNFAQDDLFEDSRYVLQSLRAAGYTQVYRVNLTRPPFDIPVVKVFVPGLEINHSLF
jgi:ribosomal protein S12 methylthiotransferase accessory factor